nr:hypothetical protein [Qipengyuania flava]
MDEDHVDLSIIGLCLGDHLLKLGTIIVCGARPAIDEGFDEDGALVCYPSFRVGDLIWYAEIILGLPLRRYPSVDGNPLATEIICHLTLSPFSPNRLSRRKALRFLHREHGQSMRPLLPERM